MNQYEAVVRVFNGDPGTAVRVWAKNPGDAYQSIKDRNESAGVTFPRLVPNEERTEEGGE